MEEYQKVNNSIGRNNSIVWKIKKWYTTNSKNKKKTVCSLETKKAAEPSGIGEVGFVSLQFHQFYFQFLALKTVTFQRTKEFIADRKAGF